MGFEWTLDENNGALILSQQDLRARSEDGDLLWDAVGLGDYSVLISAKSGLPGNNEGMAKCSADFYTDFLLSCCKRQFSGVIAVDTGHGMKKIFFQDGNICFAGSSLIDDRLGEVIYRQGMITLDQMADSAVKVNRVAKFGNILLANHIFSAAQLWEGLKAQTVEIVRSTFLVDDVYLQIQSGSNLSPTMVLFSISTTELINSCAGFGAMFRAFKNRINGDSRVVVTPSQRAWTEPEKGTFIGDMIDLIRRTGTVREVADQSKLNDINIQATLFLFANRQMIQIAEVEDADWPIVEPQSVVPIRVQLNLYNILLEKVRAAFDAEKGVFPIGDLGAFAASLRPVDFTTLCIGPLGEVTRESVLNIYAQCSSNAESAQKLLHNIRSLTQFMLQVSMDLLPSSRAMPLRKQFLETMP